VDRFLAAYERIAFGMIEKMAPAELALATTAACEHFTAIMAEGVLRTDMLGRAHPTMQALLLWHAAEEIEHRAVAFDVLREVNPSYALRVAGLALATVCLGSFWVLGASVLLASDPEVNMTRLVGDFRAARKARLERNPASKGTAQDVFLRGIREYLRPDFHPSQSDMDALAETYLKSAGLA
jgi:predicted metal-dependent hydrolase